MSLRPGWIIGILMAFLGAELLCNLGDMIWLGADTVTKLQILLTPNITDVWGYVKNLNDMLWFNYSMFDGAMAIVKYVLWCISGGFILSLTLVAAQILVSFFGKISSLFTGGI
jgi:hypothetical protein